MKIFFKDLIVDYPRRVLAQGISICQEQSCDFKEAKDKCMAPGCLFVMRSTFCRGLHELYADGYGAFSHDVTAAMLVFQNKETAAMLMYQTKTLGIELLFHANFSFCGMKLTWPMVT